MPITSTPQRSNACNSCRARKVRCEGQRPICSTCSRTHRECGYSPVLNTIEKLEDRVQELQAQLRESVVEVARAPPNKNSGYNSRSGEMGRSIQVVRPPPLSSSSAMAYIPQALRQQYPGDDIPPKLRLDLLRIFIANQSQFGLDLCIPRLEARMKLPSTDHRSLHPALINAICLVACSTFGPEVEGYEAYFLQQSREACHTSLSMMDRVDQYFVAQVLEASYLLRMGRLQEAYILSSTLLRFAMACDLHTISSPAGHYNSYRGLIGRPDDIFHVAEHINIWWSCFALARRLAAVTGLPDGLPEYPNIVTTVFPVPFSQVEAIGYDAWSLGTVQELFAQQYYQSSPSLESALSLTAKCAAITSRVQVYLASQPQLDVNTQLQVCAGISAAADCLIPMLPPVAFDAYETFGPSIIHLSVDLLFGVLSLNQRGSVLDDEARYTTRLRAARGIARLAASIDSTRVYAHIPLVYPMQGAIDVLIEAIERSWAAQSRRSSVREIQEDIRIIGGFLSRFLRSFPQLPPYLASLAHYVS